MTCLLRRQWRLTIGLCAILAAVASDLRAQPSAGAGRDAGLSIRQLDRSTLGPGGLGDATRVDAPVVGQDDTGDLVPLHPWTAGETGIGGVSAGLVNGFLTSAAGEIVSAVVPPYLKPECPAGRLLLSLDGVKDPTGGAILGRDLDTLNGATTKATFSGYYKYGFLETGLAEVRRILSNDQDLAVLPNGDVLYSRMGQTRAALPNSVEWFDYAYKISGEKRWGPGARSEIFVFRSQDCGETFRMESRIDSAGLLNGVLGAADWSGGLPQTCKTCPVTLPDGTEVYQMAGTDGPLLSVDRATGHVFLSVGVYGMHPQPTSGDEPFRLSEDRVNNTVILRSTDGGETWQRVAVLDYRAWRLEVVPMGGDLLALADYNWVEAVNIPPLPPANSVSAGYTASLPGSVNWGGPFGDKSSTNYVRSLRGQTIGASLPEPGRQLVLVRDTDDGTETGRKGWRVYGFDWTDPAAGFREFLPPIVPVKPGVLNYVFNPVIVDLGAGPKLVYWYDVTTSEADPLPVQSVQVRGRVILGEDQQTADFAISDAFTVVQPNWFGHYQMAGGFHRIEPDGLRRTAFFPVWTQPDGNVRFRHLEFHAPGPRPNELGQVVPGVVVPAGKNPVRTRIGPRPEVSMEWLEEHEAEETGLQGGEGAADTGSRRRQ